MSPVHDIDTYYHRTVSRAALRPALRAHIDTETCVVGGGLAGVATALGLAQRGRPVVLLEANGIGWGASGRNGGILSSGFALGARALEARVGLPAAQELHRLSSEAVDLVRRRAEAYTIDCLTTPSGTVRNAWFNATDAVKANIDHMNRHYASDLEYRPHDWVREHYRSPRYHDAVFNPHGHQIHPLAYANGCAEAAERMGAVIHEGTAVTRITRRGSDHVVHTASGAVRASNVVVCCSGHIGWLKPRLSLATLPIGTYVVLTEPLGERVESAIRAPFAAGDNRRVENYYRVLPDTRLLWGGGMSISRRPANLETRMMEDLFGVFPQLRGLRAEVAWAGTMGYARHRMPQIGQLEPGFWYNQGHGGHGLNTTTMGGELIARAIADADDTYRMFKPFGLDFTGGPVGLLAAQLIYWGWKLQDRWDARQG